MRLRGSGRAAALMRIIAVAVAACAAASLAAAAADAAPGVPSYAESARQDAAEVALPPALTTALVELGEQLDACRNTPFAEDVASYVPSNGGTRRIAADLRDLDDAARRCAGTHRASWWPKHGSTASEALRERLRDEGHHSKFVRALVRPCVMKSPDDEPPTGGAWALNAWLHDTRNALEGKRGCLAHDTYGVATAADACGCGRAVATAAATTFLSTAAAALALGAVLRRHGGPPGGSMPRRRLRGTAALGAASSSHGGVEFISADGGDMAHKKRHSFSGPEPPRPHQPALPSQLV